MAASCHIYKNRFKQIFADGWEEFKRKHPRYAAVDEVVQKMLGCGDPANGHAVYLCPECQERCVVAFSCKSQFCLSCAKVSGLQWVATVQAMLHPGVKYRHLILTVPQALRTLIYQHAAVVLDGLMQAVQRAMDRVVAQTKRQAVKLGYIVVLQTAGRSASYNPHLHVIMTDGGLRADGTWQRLGYVPYDLLSQGKTTTETVSRETFIGRMVQHILPKGFQRIRYYGLQATCILKKLREQVIQALHVVAQQVMELGEAVLVRRPGYRQRMLSAFGRDPLICPQCGSTMWLWQIWHPQYGLVYDELERMKAGVYERTERPLCCGAESDRARDAGALSDGDLQLPLFTLPA